MFNLAKEIVQTNIDVWGEQVLINAFIVTFTIGVIVSIILIKRK
jgi:hypothetical protein